jgi:hypothetical protein
VVIFSEYPDVAGREYIEESNKVLFTDKWDDVLGTFQELNGTDAKVAVYPSADVQYRL